MTTACNPDAAAIPLVGSTPWLGGSVVDYFYASLYKRLYTNRCPETIERHEARLMAAAEKRHEAEYQGRKKWRAQYDRQRGLCAICQQPTPPEKMTRDHIVPRAKGGGTEWDNIQLTCEPCNQNKGDSMPPHSAICVNEGNNP